MGSPKVKFAFKTLEEEVPEYAKSEGVKRDVDAEAKVLDEARKSAVMKAVEVQMEKTDQKPQKPKDEKEKEYLEQRLIRSAAATITKKRRVDQFKTMIYFPDDLLMAYRKYVGEKLMKENKKEPFQVFFERIMRRELSKYFT